MTRIKITQKQRQTVAVMGFEPSPLKLDLLEHFDLISAFHNVLHVNHVSVQ